MRTREREGERERESSIFCSRKIALPLRVLRNCASVKQCFPTVQFRYKWRVKKETCTDLHQLPPRWQMCNNSVVSRLKQLVQMYTFERIVFFSRCFFFFQKSFKPLPLSYRRIICQHVIAFVQQSLHSLKGRYTVTCKKNLFKKHHIFLNI